MPGGRAYHAVRIAESWRSSVEGIFETGWRLLEAKADLRHGEFTPLVEKDLGWRMRDAQRLMYITKHLGSPKAADLSLLRPSVEALYELARLSESMGWNVVKRHLVPGGLTVKEVQELRRQLIRPPKIEKTPLLPDGKVGSIVADPPYQYPTEMGLYGGLDPRDHYPTMTTDAICEVPVCRCAAEDAVLWLWTPNRHFLTGEAIRVARVWGFEPKQVFTWCKEQLGVGAYARTNTEHCVLAIRGQPRVYRISDAGTWFIAPRRRHSEKPDHIHELAERFGPGPYIELFARRPRPGWTVWGNEVDGDAAA